MVPKVSMNKSQIQTSFENSLFKIFILPKLNVNKKEFNIKPNVIGLMWKIKKKNIIKERYSSWLRGHIANVLGGRNVVRGFEPHSFR